MEGCILGCLVTRGAARMGENKEHYSLTTPKIIENIGFTFDALVS